MGWRKKKQRIYKVLVIATDKDTRQELVDYYFEHLEIRYASNARSIVFRARGFSEAQGKIYSKGLSLNLNLIVFPLDFPEAETIKIREWLSHINMAAPFIMVPLKPVKAA